MSGPGPGCGKAAAIVLAGGASMRFGRADKRFAEIGGQRLIDRVEEFASQQFATVVISLGADPAADAGWRPRSAAAVVRDAAPGDEGPLAGLAAGIEWISEHRPSVERVVAFPVDTPLLPDDYASRLIAGDDSRIAIACWRGHAHFLCSSWPVRCARALAEYLRSGARKAETFAGLFGSYPVDFSDYDLDPFVNVNTPGDLGVANERLRR